MGVNNVNRPMWEFRIDYEGSRNTKIRSMNMIIGYKYMNLNCLQFRNIVIEITIFRIIANFRHFSFRNFIRSFHAAQGAVLEMIPSSIVPSTDAPV